MHTQNPRLFAFFIIVFAALGGMLYGYDIGILAGAFPFLNRDVPMTAGQLHFMPGAVLFGGAFATLITGPLCDLWGRKKLIIAASIIFIVGVILVGMATDYVSILSGRLIQGIGIGIVTIAIPLYLAEAVPAHIRGQALCAFQLLLTAGILIASLIGWLLTATGNWRGMFFSAMVPAILLFAGSLFLPESPRWLSMKGNFEKALAILARSRALTVAKDELAQMTQVITSQQADTSASWRQRRFLVPLIIVFIIACANQLTGINSLLQLAPVVLRSAGLPSDVIAMLGAVAITGLNFLVTILALFLVDRIGRRFLLCLGTGGIVISLVFCGGIAYFLPTSVFKGELLLAGILCFIFFFAIGPGVAVWLVLSELLPSRIRSSGMAVALFLNSMTSAILATSFLGLADAIGYAGVFWLCAGFTLIYFITVFFFVPETKKKTLEEIEIHFDSIAQVNNASVVKA